MNLTISFITPLNNKFPFEITSGKVFMPRHGPVAIASRLERLGHDVTVFDENAGSRINWKRVWSSDVVCLSLMSFCACKGYEYAAKTRSRSKAPIIIGGPHATLMPDECLKHCDWVIRKEGDETLPLLIEELFHGNNPKNLAGISFKEENGYAVHNPARDFVCNFDSPVNMSLVDGYRALTIARGLKDALTRMVPRFNVLPVQTSRGCPFMCRFCFVKDELGLEYRLRDPDAVVQDIETGLNLLKTRYVMFVDNDITINREHTKSLFEKIARRFGGDLELYFFARISLSKDQEMLEWMRTAGNICVAVGVESINDDTLIQFSKGQTREQIADAISAFSKNKINIQALTIFGGEEDTAETVRETIDFYIENKVYNIGVCALYDFPSKGPDIHSAPMWPSKRFIHHDWRFFNGNFVVFYPRRIKPSSLQREISRAFERFYKSQKQTVFQYHPSLATAKHYASYLETMEKGLYTRDGSLIEENLPVGPRESAIPLSVPRSSIVGEAAGFYAHKIGRASCRERV